MAFVIRNWAANSQKVKLVERRPLEIFFDLFCVFFQVVRLRGEPTQKMGQKQ